MFFQIKDIEFVDPGRKQDQRGFTDRFGGRAILDQFKQVIAEHHVAGRCGDVLTDLEGGFVGQRDLQFTTRSLEIGNQMFQPVQQALAFGFDGKSQGIGVGRQKIRRAEHIDDLIAEEFQPLAVLVIQPVDFGHRRVNRLHIVHVLLLHKVEVGVGLPQRIGETFVGGGVIGRGDKVALGQLLLRFDKVFDGFAPVADLMFDHLGRVGHHFSPKIGRCFDVKLLVGALQILWHTAFVRERIDQTLRQPFDLG